MLPQLGTYLKTYDGQTKCLYFLIEDDELLEKYNTICDKNSAYVKKEFDSETVNNKEFLKNKINLRKSIFACLFSIHNAISLSCHEQDFSLKKR